MKPIEAIPWVLASIPLLYILFDRRFLERYGRVDEVGLEMSQKYRTWILAIPVVLLVLLLIVNALPANPPSQ